MSASINDKLTQIKPNTTTNAPVTTVATSRAIGGTSLSCVDLTDWPTDTAIFFQTYKKKADGTKDFTTAIDGKGIVSSDTIGSVTITNGTDAGNAIGDYVELNPTAAYGEGVYEWGTTEHGVDGTHKAITATSVVSTGSVSGTTGVFSSDVSDNSTTLKTIRSEVQFDFVASGCVISGDSYGSTLAYSMTSGVVYIGGKRVAVSSFSAHSATASKDMYIDVDNTGAITHTAVANNAASPALASNSIRLGIVVAGGTSIASVASINQGQENKVLPIASSTPYAVTDSLGNLICPRDPNRKLLGLRRITSNYSNSATSATAITGLSVPFQLPTGRKYKATFGADAVLNDGGGGTTATTEVNIYEGASLNALTTQLRRLLRTTIGGTYYMPFEGSIDRTPGVSNPVFVTASLHGNSGSQVNTVQAGVAAFVRIELV